MGILKIASDFMDFAMNIERPIMGEVVGGGDDVAIFSSKSQMDLQNHEHFWYFSYCVGVIQSGGDLILFDNVMLWPSPGFTKISVEQCGASEHTASLTRHSLRGQKT